MSLLGRDLCSKLNIEIVLSSNKHCTHAVNQDVFTKHKSYLWADFKSSVKKTIHHTIDEKSTPLFCTARCVPVRYRKLVKLELDRLAQQEIITKVFKCEWACPTVNVMKPDGNVRICGDYSPLTVNKRMKLVKYPLPSVVISNVLITLINKLQLLLVYTRMLMKKVILVYVCTYQCRAFAI